MRNFYFMKDYSTDFEFLSENKIFIYLLLLFEL